MDKKEISKIYLYSVIIEPCEEGGFIAYIQEIPGINTQGETIDEAKKNLTEAINLMFEERRADRNNNNKGRVKNLITQTLSFSL